MVAKNKKGHILLEQVFIVSMGVIILIMVVTVFSTLESNTTDFVAERQFENIGVYVHSAVIQAYELGRFSSGAKVALDLPASVAGHRYSISLNNTHILIESTTGDVNKSSPLYNIDTDVNLSGSITSTTSKVYVRYNRSANNITLESE